MVLFLSPIIPLCIVRLHVMSVLLSLLCPLKFAISICFLRTWSYRTVSRSLRPLLVAFIGRPHGAPFLFSIWIVRLLTLVGRSPKVSSILPNASCPFVCLFLYLAFVVPLLSFLSICFLLPPCSECFGLASVPHVLLFSNVPCYPL